MRGVRNGGGAPVDDTVEIAERGAIDLGERTIRSGQRGASPGYPGLAVLFSGRTTVRL
jgi:hypothetical protein